MFKNHYSTQIENNISCKMADYYTWGTIGLIATQIIVVVIAFILFLTLSGTTGSVGNTGPQGPQGSSSGTQGVIGPVGESTTVTGPQGYQGVIGQQGPQGLGNEVPLKYIKMYYSYLTGLGKVQNFALWSGTPNSYNMLNIPNTFYVDTETTSAQGDPTNGGTLTVSEDGTYMLTAYIAFTNFEQSGTIKIGVNGSLPTDNNFTSTLNSVNDASASCYFSGILDLKKGNTLNFFTNFTGNSRNLCSGTYMMIRKIN